MPLIVNILLIIVSSIVLIKAVKLFINSTTKIAHHWGISEYTISFLIVGIATSLPEIVVGITSAIEGNPILAYGNAIGSNIALLTLIIGIPILLSKGVSTRTILHSRDAYVGTLFAGLPIALSMDGLLSKIDGIILIAGYSFYFFMSLRRGTILELIMDRLEHINVWKQGVYFVTSLLLLLASSEVIVRSAQGISIDLGWSLSFVGLSLMALGTSLPELAYTIRAAKDGKSQSILGDVIGSIVANSTAVLGITALIRPINVHESQTGVTSLAFLLFTILVFLRFSKTREKIDKTEATILIIIYAVFLAVEYSLQNKAVIPVLF